MKYQSSGTHYSNVINKVKVFKKQARLQGHGYKVKNVGFHWKFLLLEILMWNIKALALTVQNSLARSIFLFVKLQSQGHMVKSVGTHGKVLPLEKL